MAPNLLNTMVGTRLLKVHVEPEQVKKVSILLNRAGFKTWKVGEILWSESKGFTLDDAAYYMSVVLSGYYGNSFDFNVEIVGN